MLVLRIRMSHCLVFLASLCICCLDPGIFVLLHQLDMLSLGKGSSFPKKSPGQAVDPITRRAEPELTVDSWRLAKSFEAFYSLCIFKNSLFLNISRLAAVVPRVTDRCLSRTICEYMIQFPSRNSRVLTLLYQLRQGCTTSGSSIPCSSMYQMLKLKLGPQDIRGTKKKREKTHTNVNAEWSPCSMATCQFVSALTYFDKSAGKHLLVYLVLQGECFLVVVILKATGGPKKKKKWRWCSFFTNWFSELRCQQHPNADTCIVTVVQLWQLPKVHLSVR